jgi:hypothetical protein
VGWGDWVYDSYQSLVQIRTAPNLYQSMVEKGGSVQPYSISKQGLATITDYLKEEKEQNL